MSIEELAAQLRSGEIDNAELAQYADEYARDERDLPQQEGRLTLTTNGAGRTDGEFPSLGEAAVANGGVLRTVPAQPIGRHTPLLLQGQDYVHAAQRRRARLPGADPQARPGRCGRRQPGAVRAGAGPLRRHGDERAVHRAGRARRADGPAGRRPLSGPLADDLPGRAPDRTRPVDAAPIAGVAQALRARRPADRPVARCSARTRWTSGARSRTGSPTARTGRR